MYLFRSRVDHHHYHHADQDTRDALHLIIKNQKKMNEDLDQIKSDLQAANTTLGKVRADVTILHTKIDAIPVQPTAEEWAEVKTLAANLKVGLQEVDDKTEDEATA